MNDKETIADQSGEIVGSGSVGLGRTLKFNADDVKVYDEPADLEPGKIIARGFTGVQYGRAWVDEYSRHEHQFDALAYMLQMAPKDVTRHAELEKVMADAKQAVDEACGLRLRDGMSAVEFGIDAAGNLTAKAVPAGRMYEASDWQGAEQAKAFDCARPSDRDGIEEELRRELRGVPVPIAKPQPVETAKPALAGLGVMASGDHRPGLWRTFD